MKKDILLSKNEFTDGEGGRGNVRKFRTNIKKMPLSTVWGWKQPKNFFILLLLKILPISLYGTDLICHPSIREVDVADTDDVLRDNLREGLLLLTQHLDFTHCGFHTANLIGQTKGLAAHLISPDKKSGGLVMSSISGNEQVSAISFFSFFSEGRVLAYSNASVGLPEPPHIKGDRCPGVKGARLYTLHREALAREEARSNLPIALSCKTILSMIGENDERSAEYYLKTGLYEEVFEEDMDDDFSKDIKNTSAGNKEETFEFDEKPL